MTPDIDFSDVNLNLSGAFTALVTPMKPDANSLKETTIDYNGFGRIVNYQIDGGIDGIVVLGTTAETPTLEDDEEEKLIKIAAQEINGRAKFIIGTTSNDTCYAVEWTRRARDAGADAALVAAPYYNKPNTSGLLKHFEKILDVGLPVILYNIPGRTGRNISIDEMKFLARHPNVIGVKEASGDMVQIKRVINEIKKPLQARGRNFGVLSGDDGLTAQVIREGGDGVVSVISNLVPGKVKALTDAGLSGDAYTMDAIDNDLQELSRMAFIDGNPVSIKYLTWLAGIIDSPSCRLPLGPIDPKKGKKLVAFMNVFLKENKIPVR
ncbi:MAG: 4-hydroxy-tetrahydrodipicolinate synthase [Rickettsiales bacterium]|jgi:4-hydroxy-tetrahydrodipicolinate synthase|nr:4-hydroxy-tetrahydrodipicolinate synthase [Rickettsiales bacterium]